MEIIRMTNIDSDLKKRIKIEAVKHEVTMTNYIMNAVKHYMSCNCKDKK
jgi:plasmid stability protein